MNWTKTDKVHGATLYDIAIGRAHSQWREFNRRFDWVTAMPSNAPRELRDAVFAWVGEVWQ